MTAFEDLCPKRISNYPKFPTELVAKVPMTNRVIDSEGSFWEYHHKSHREGSPYVYWVFLGNLLMTGSKLIERK